jgi:hypothetical protein
MTKLLHIEKWIPLDILDIVFSMQKLIDVSKFSFSRHIQEHFAKGDQKHSYNKKGLMECLASLKDEPIDPFEVEVEKAVDGKILVTKYVVRIPYDKNRDISVSIRGNKIITAWLNFIDDVHHTLDLSKYDDTL